MTVSFKAPRDAIIRALQFKVPKFVFGHGCAIGSSTPFAGPFWPRSGRCVLITMLFLAVPLLSGYRGSGSSPGPNPMPSVASLAPSSISAGAAAFTLTVNGANFISTSRVQWNGSTRPTSYVSATQLTASIAATDIATPTYVSVTVVNPTPGGGTSAGVEMTPLWAKPAHGGGGLLVDAPTDLTSRAQLNSFGGPLFAAWNPKRANAMGPGMHILMFGTPVALCPPHSQGPMSGFSDAELTSDGYPGHASAVPADMRFEPTPMTACSSAAAENRGPGLVFFDRSKAWMYTASLGKPTDLLSLFSSTGQNGQGANAHIVVSSVNHRLPNPGSTIEPWALNGRARLAALAQVVSIRAQDAADLTQTKQEMAIYLINTRCTISNPTRLCQIYYQFSQVLAQSNVSDWRSASAYQTPNFFLDRAQNNLPIVDVALIPEAGETVTSKTGLPLFTSRGRPTQHAAFAPMQFDVEIEFSQFENAIRIASAFTLGHPVEPDATCAQCVQVFGMSWNDPRSWMLLQLASHQEIYDASGKSGEILGSYSWIYGGAAP
jgi:hypothetical protein